MQKKLINRKARLKIWRGVRRRVKKCIDLSEQSQPPAFAWRFGLCYFLREELHRLLIFRKSAFCFCEDMPTFWFPEMQEYLPKYALICDYWWPLDLEGYRARLEVCNEIIKKLEYKK